MKLSMKKKNNSNWRIPARDYLDNNDIQVASKPSWKIQNHLQDNYP